MNPDFNPYAAPEMPAEEVRPVVEQSNTLLYSMSEAWRMMMRHPLLVFATITVFAIPIDLIISYINYLEIDFNNVTDYEDYLDRRRLISILGMIDNVLPMFAFGAILHVAKTEWNGHRAGVLTALSGAYLFFLPLTLAMFMAGIAIMIGFVFLIIPGIYLWLRFCFTNAAIVVDRRGPLKAISASFAVSGDNMKVAAGLGGLFLATLAVNLTYGIAFGFILNRIASWEYVWVVDGAMELPGMLLVSWYQLVALFTYCRLRDQSRPFPATMSEPATTSSVS